MWIARWTILEATFRMTFASNIFQTGTFQREKQTLMKKMKLLFLFNLLTEWIDTTHLMRLCMHNKAVEEGSSTTDPCHVIWGRQC